MFFQPEPIYRFDLFCPLALCYGEWQVDITGHRLVLASWVLSVVKVIGLNSKSHWSGCVSCFKDWQLFSFNLISVAICKVPLLHIIIIFPFCLTENLILSALHLFHTHCSTLKSVKQIKRINHIQSKRQNNEFMSSQHHKADKKNVKTRKM